MLQLLIQLALILYHLYTPNGGIEQQPEGIVPSFTYYLYPTIASIIMCEITGVKRNRLIYIVIIQTILYNISI